MKKKSLIIGVIIFFIDQLLKIIVDKSLLLNGSINIINSFLYLNKVYNYGASWSMLSGMRWLLIIISLIALVFLIKYQSKIKESLWAMLSFGFIYGGLLGNLMDRIIRGYVIDYISVYFGKYAFPIFNLADIFLVIGFFILLIIVYKGGEKNEVDS